MKQRMRRGMVMAACGVIGAGAVLGAAGSAAGAVVAQSIASGLDKPIGLANAPGDYKRLFVHEKVGRLRAIDISQPTPVLHATPFLDITALVSTLSTMNPFGDERGLLGVAFHPQFQTNGKFYVNYTSKAITGLPAGYSFYTVIAEYVVRAGPGSPPDPTLATADPTSARTVLRVLQPQSNHNGGWMGFGPDGYLYIASGDGGNGDDVGFGHNGTIGNGQDTGTLLGKMLRIDVDSVGPAPQGPLWTGTDPGSTADDSVVAYGVPMDNPTLPVVSAGTSPSRREIWAYGLRNPWRSSFDRMTGDLWIADVGQGSWEEINRQPALTGTNLAQVAGLNYGWRCFEGSVLFSTNGGRCPAAYDAAGLAPPAGVYSSGGTGTPARLMPIGVTGACSVTGGYVYRGCRVPELSGRYVFADACIGSRIWSTTPDPVTGVLAAPIAHTGLFAGSAAVTPSVPAYSNQQITGFGEDGYGELYLVGQVSGTVFRLVSTTDTGIVLSNPDYNRNGFIDLLDIFAFLEDWFAVAGRADYSRANGVDLLDIFEFLEAWFGGCAG